MKEIRAGQILCSTYSTLRSPLTSGTIPGLVGGPAVAARLAPKPVTPPYVQYDKPPLSFGGDAVGVAELDGFSVRVRVFDYGVMSLPLSRPFEGSWRELVARSQTLIESAEIEQHAEQACGAIIDRLRPALHRPHDTFLSEDYLVYAINELERPMSAEELLVGSGLRRTPLPAPGIRQRTATWPVVRQESAHRRIPDVVRDVQSLLISELL